MNCVFTLVQLLRINPQGRRHPKIWELLRQLSCCFSLIFVSYIYIYITTLNVLYTYVVNLIVNGQNCWEFDSALSIETGSGTGYCESVMELLHLAFYSHARRELSQAISGLCDGVHMAPLKRLLVNSLCLYR